MANMSARGGGYEFEWRGDDIHRSVRNNSRAGMDALRDIALSVMNAHVPVETGYLKSTIYAYLSQDGTVLVLVFGALAFYTLFVELGTVDHPPQPFIRPAADAVKSNAYRAFTQTRNIETGRFE